MPDRRPAPRSPTAPRGQTRINSTFIARTHPGGRTRPRTDARLPADMDGNAERSSAARGDQGARQAAVDLDPGGSCPVVTAGHPPGSRELSWGRWHSDRRRALARRRCGRLVRCRGAQGGEQPAPRGREPRCGMLELVRSRVASGAGQCASLGLAAQLGGPGRGQVVADGGVHGGLLVVDGGAGET